MRFSHRLRAHWLLAIGLYAAFVGSMDDSLADDAPKLTGTLYASIFKIMPPAANNKPRQVIAIDMSTGQVREVGCEGIAPRVEPHTGRVASWRFGQSNDLNGDDRADEIWVHDLNGKTEPFIVGTGSSIGGWVNDGKQLFVAQAKRNKATDKWEYTNHLVHADGSASEALDMPKTDRIVDCTPDGQWLLVFRGRGLWVKEAGDEKMKQIAGQTNSTFKGRFSPDGTQVSYVASSRLGDRVMIVNRDGTGAKELYKAEGVTEAEDVCWSPDGKSIALDTFDWRLENGQKIRMSGEDHNCKIVIISVADKRQQSLQLPDLPLSEISEMDWQAK